jgi:hypothetical protein
MKKTISIPLHAALIMAGLFIMMNGSGQSSDSVQSSIEWSYKAYDFGKVPQGKPVTVEYQFKNPSMVPLIINSVRPSCGCTIADYPKEPIQPQKSGSIKVTFNAASSGFFQKSVTVMSNAGVNPEVLTFKVEVVAAGEPATTSK